MDVAEDIGKTFPRERDLLLASSFIKTQIEPLSIEEGEDVMEEGVRVGEENDASDWDDEYVRREHTILLQQHITAVSGEGKSSVSNRFEPCDCGGHVLRMTIARRGLVLFDELERNVDMLLRRLRLCATSEAGHQRSAYDSEDSRFDHGENQNLYAATRPKMLAVDVEELTGELCRWRYSSEKRR